MERFAAYLENELNTRQWKPADLARRAGIPDATLSRILNQTRKPGPQVCTAIAHALDQPPEKLFRLAGLLPDLPPAVLEEHEVLLLIRNLPADTRQMALRILRSLQPTARPATAESTHPYQPDNSET